MPVSTKEALISKEAMASAKPASETKAVRQLQKVRIQSVIRACRCCHCPPPKIVF